MICNNILEAMGNTPIIRLQHMVDENSAEILVKFEKCDKLMELYINIGREKEDSYEYKT